MRGHGRAGRRHRTSFEYGRQTRYAARFQPIRPATFDRRLHTRLTSLLWTDLAEMQRLERTLARSWSTAAATEAGERGGRRALEMQSLALRLGSEGCGVLFDPAPVIPGS
jgi:hypothetical protein